MKSSNLWHPTGQALLEFALVISILIFLLMGIFDLGRVVYTNTDLSNAAREGARFAAVNHDCGTSGSSIDAVKSQVISKGITVNIQTGQIGVTCYQAGGTTTTDKTQAATVKVSITNYPFLVITPMVGSINLSASASMTVEQ